MERKQSSVSELLTALGFVMNLLWGVTLGILTGWGSFMLTRDLSFSYMISSGVSMVHIFFTMDNTILRNSIKRVNIHSKPKKSTRTPSKR
jgi:hypothetical protein